MQQSKARGPLAGVRIVEFAGIGPGPFCGMLLSDMGADIVRIDRAQGHALDTVDLISRGRRSVCLDLKNPAAVATVLQLLEKADALIEGYRPGVMERLGLGPDIVLARNAKLVYGRMTGWGQYGPLAHAAGHDINYTALSGALYHMGPRDKPMLPLNLVGDFGGGALYLAFGLLAALLHARATGEGQVIDCAMTDGAASLMTMFYSMRESGIWSDKRADNVLDGGAYFYDVYECADGQWISLGPIEPHFHQQLLDLLGMEAMDFSTRHDRATWAQERARLQKKIASQPRSHWDALLSGTDVCYAPVLSMMDAPEHPHHRARETYIEVDGITQPAPAPRFSRTPGQVQGPPPVKGAHNESALSDWGFSADEIAALQESKVLLTPS